jgi:signal transduction protein with GAF and PtsI domain
MSSDTLTYLRQESIRLQDENKLLQDEVHALRQYVEAVHSLVDAVSSWDPKGDVMPLLDTILYNALTVLDAKDGSLLVLDDDTSELVFVLARGDVEESKLLGLRIPKGQGIAGWVASNAKPAIVNNPSQDPRFLPSVDKMFNFKTESLLAAPIVGSGRVMGVIEVLNKYSGEKFNPADQTLLTLLCYLAGDVLHRLVTGDSKTKKGSAKKDSAEGESV